MPINKAELKENISYAFIAQILSMGVSTILALVIPKVLGIHAFSYWQLFIFYALYGGFLPIGLTDGMYLRLGGKKYEELKFNVLGSQYLYSFVFQLFVCILICVSCHHYISEERLMILVVSCISALIQNIINYFYFNLQAVNLVKISSLSIVLNKSIFLGILITLVAIDIKDYKILIFLFVLTDTISLFFLIIKCKEFVRIKILPINEIWKEMKENISVGLSLTISSVASMSILGIGRFFVDSEFGIIEFGKISFAILLMNFFIVFLRQVSLVLFPALRRLEKSEIPIYFNKLDTIFNLLSPICLLFYPVIYFFIDIWLPNYRDSLDYLMILFPLVCYEGKMQMVNNTFLKVSREEKKMLCFNVTACLFSLILCFISVFIIHSLKLTVMLMMVSIGFRSIWSELFLFKKYNLEISKDLFLLFLYVLIFFATNVCLRVIEAFCIYGSFYLVVLYLYRESLNIYFVQAKNKLSIFTHKCKH